jgi:hypothetical protein
MEGIKMNNIDNLIVAIFIMIAFMIAGGTFFGVWFVAFMKLFRNDIKESLNFMKEKYKDNEMKEISGNKNDDGDKPYDEIEKRHRLQNFLKKTSLERAKTNRKYSETETINSGEIIEKINETVEEPESYKKGYDNFNKELNSFCESLVNNKEKEQEKSIKEELENLSIVSFDKDDIPYQSKIERSIEETDTNLSFIENEPTIEPVIEDTEIIFEKNQDNIALDLFRQLTKEQQFEFAKTVIPEKYTSDNCPNDCKKILISKNLEKYCKNSEMLDFEDKKVTVNKDFNTGKYKFDFDEPAKTAIEDIYKCNHDNYYHNQGYQL